MLVEQYINELCKRLNVDDYVGIIAYGSYIGGRSNSLSDLDVMIIKDKHDTQDCGSMMINGIRVEYFVQDIKRLYKLIKEQIDNNDPSHLTKFATCKIIYDKDGRTKEFIDYAKILYNTKITQSFDDNDRFSIFSINNRIEDLESLINSDSFYSVYFVTLEKIRTLYSKINGIIELPIMKVSEIYRNTDYARKYISSPVHKLPSEEFINLYLVCIKIGNRVDMLNNLKRLFAYSFGELGFDPNNFSLSFKQKAPFKV